jgi:hypothetical protein
MTLIKEKLIPILLISLIREIKCVDIIIKNNKISATCYFIFIP